MEYMKKGSRADLHNHTTASDGLLAPAQLIEYAVLKGLAAVAITDHDTVNGIDEALSAGRMREIVVIPGIELNTQLESKEIHILGYYINWKSRQLLEILAEMKNARKNRARKMIQKLVELYNFDINYDEILRQARDGVIGRLHIARVLVSKGMAKDINDAFLRYLDVGCPAYVERYHLAPEEGIRLIKSIGGVAVIAHPGLLPDSGLLNDIIKIGIDGIEVFHSRHTQEQTYYYANIARLNNLLITGGSDCHGELINGMPIIGDVSVSMEEVEHLKSRAKKKK
ncbi:MAG: PHP domain-containing protein [Caldicoprobacterales bacterium]|jgi:predicted metal-dependent phosphoesterase TrpH|nr:PHP domain-containing protein [Clostridiales bacterium]